MHHIGICGLEASVWQRSALGAHRAFASLLSPKYISQWAAQNIHGPFSSPSSNKVIHFIGSHMHADARPCHKLSRFRPWYIYARRKYIWYLVNFIDATVVTSRKLHRRILQMIYWLRK